MHINRFFNPFGYFFTIIKVCHLVQAIKQKEEVAPFKETLPKTRGSFQVYAGKLFLNKSIKPFVSIGQFPQRQKDREHVFRQTGFMQIGFIRTFPQTP